MIWIGEKKRKGKLSGIFLTMTARTVYGFGFPRTVNYVLHVSREMAG